MATTTELDNVFHVYTHHTQASHLRTYRGSSRDEGRPFTIELKQYVPRANTDPKPGDVTMIAAPGIGFPKECYEPLFADLVAQCTRHKVGVRGIWIADSVMLGRSGLLNQERLGNEVSWFDHSRDLLHIINTFHESMPRPLVGLGHSMGGAQIAYLSSLHPSLFTALLLVEPSTHPSMPRIVPLTQVRGMLRRKDSWPDRSSAEEALRKNPYYGSWDSRVLDRFLRYGLHELEREGDQKSKPTRTVANKHLEAAHIFRLNDKEIGKKSPSELTPEQRKHHPDVDATDPEHGPLYSPGSRQAFSILPYLRPKVLYINGRKSPFGSKKIVEARLESTGTGLGGSGGYRQGCVKQVWVEDGQHTIPLDGSLPEVAQAAGEFLSKVVQRWRAEQEESVWSEDQRRQSPPGLCGRFIHTVQHYDDEKERLFKSKM